MLHLLEHAQICAAAPIVLRHGGPDARKDDDKRGMDHRGMLAVRLCCFRGAAVVCGEKRASEAIPALDKDQEGIHKCEKIGAA